jgi:hypothetical protein
LQFLLEHARLSAELIDAPKKGKKGISPPASKAICRLRFPLQFYFARTMSFDMAKSPIPSLACDPALSMLSQVPRTASPVLLLPQPQSQSQSQQLHSPLDPQLNAISGSNSLDFGKAPSPLSHAIAASNSFYRSASSGAASAAAASYKLTHIGPVGGSNVVVSRLDVPRPTSTAGMASAVSGGTGTGLSANGAMLPPFYPANGSYAPQHQPPSLRPPSNSSTPSNAQHYANHMAPSRGAAYLPIHQQPLLAAAASSSSAQPQMFRQHVSSMASSVMSAVQSVPVTKFTNMVPNAARDAKNPLKPAHSTLLSGSDHQYHQHQLPLLSAPAHSGYKTSLKASDLIHILPNLVQTLKRKQSLSGGSNTANSSQGANTAAAGCSLQAAPPAPMAKPASVLAAEQLLSVIAKAPGCQPAGEEANEYDELPTAKRLKGHLSGSFSGSGSGSGSDIPNANSQHHSSLLHQCESCGKTYKHRNCLSKHLWEHHDAWEHTRRVCQTKHQQVQLLEAAQVLAEIRLGLIGKERRLLMMQQQQSGRRVIVNANSGTDKTGEELQTEDGEAILVEEEMDMVNVDDESVIDVVNDSLKDPPGLNASRMMLSAPVAISQ